MIVLMHLSTRPQDKPKLFFLETFAVYFFFKIFNMLAESFSSLRCSIESFVQYPGALHYSNFVVNLLSCHMWEDFQLPSVFLLNNPLLKNLNSFISLPRLVGNHSRHCVKTHMKAPRPADCHNFCFCRGVHPC